MQVEVCVNFMMFMARTLEGARTCIVSMNMVNMFSKEIEKIDQKISLALDFGNTKEAKSFSFDEEKMALFINF